MRTLTSPRDDASADTGVLKDEPGGTIPRFLGITTLLVAVSLGILIGLWIGRDAGPAVLTADGTDLTSRQAEMLDVVEGYGDAWRANDGDLAATFMTETAVVRYLQEDWEFRPADGSLQSWIASPRYATLIEHDLRIVDDDRVVLFGRVGSVAIDWISIIQFTPTGEPLIVGETIDHW